MASHRRPSQPGFTHGARITVLSAAAATAAAAFGAAPPASAEPHETAEEARAKVDRLYEEAEKATERFNKAEERVERLRERVTQAQDRVARGQEAVNRMRTALGSLAGAQYRSGGMDPSLALLLSEDPDGYLDKAVTLDRITERQATALSDLREAQRRIGQERAEAGRDLAELEQGRRTVAWHKRVVEGKLAEAQRLLNALSARERAVYDEARASRSGRGDSLPEASGPGPASARAAAAVAAARSAVGRPYVWGANGPSSFDCSGLMQWSYAQAGVGLPRTSQAQRYAGRRVPLSQARPGDLVTYRSDASHVGMYMGNGQVVHAPYPGASVRYDPVGMMPIASVTRV
ncbi:C40 family peptidase [Streptomyces sp. MUM 178J]|uniref:C40 family peptidase n=1 Tax=Streptomyces sp. MUM 178J TaxID=2791991 RepID=UPI001F04CCCD|nr:C40 family peptidase [Streptomyces sp. MUM 178J]WRQ79037.1 C40 family peptidase [Streptomyces sp. MUM 178J]